MYVKLWLLGSLDLKLESLFFFSFFGEKLLPCFDNMNFRLSSSPLCLSLSVYFLEGG